MNHLLLLILFIVSESICISQVHSASYFNPSNGIKEKNKQFMSDLLQNENVITSIDSININLALESMNKFSFSAIPDDPLTFAHTLLIHSDSTKIYQLFQQTLTYDQNGIAKLILDSTNKDEILAICAMLNLPPDFSVLENQESPTIQSLIDNSLDKQLPFIRNYFGPFYEFTLFALGTYHSSSTLKNTKLNFDNGNHIVSLEYVAKEMTKTTLNSYYNSDGTKAGSPAGKCKETHQFMGLVLIFSKLGDQSAQYVPLILLQEKHFQHLLYQFRLSFEQGIDNLINNNLEFENTVFLLGHLIDALLWSENCGYVLNDDYRKMVNLSINFLSELIIRKEAIRKYPIGTTRGLLRFYSHTYHVFKLIGKGK